MNISVIPCKIRPDLTITNIVEKHIVAPLNILYSHKLDQCYFLLKMFRIKQIVWFHRRRNAMSGYPIQSKILKKRNTYATFWARFSKTWQKPIYTRVRLNTLLYRIQRISARITLATKCLTYTDSEIFYKIVKIGFRISETT